MGIPSYYRKWLDQAPDLITENGPADSIDWLFMDFNCLIYQCLSAEGLSDYSADRHNEWESEFIDAILCYTREVVSLACPTTGVYIAIDGVVPMAKMRQQRLRRWKSVMLSTTPSIDAWPKNSITPGTIFMSKLGTALQSLSTLSSSLQWVLSSSDEPGEGEHKIMAAWRSWSKLSTVKRMAVYGLDADLIVLSLLGREQWRWGAPPNIWLFREQMTSSEKSSNVSTIHHEWFSIDAMREWLCTQMGNIRVTPREWIEHYAFAMSVLGNDFLPRSLSLTLREEGHSLLLQGLRECCQRGPIKSWQPLWKWLARDEHDRIKDMIGKRRRQAQYYDAELEENMPLFHRQLEDGLMDLRTWEERYMTRFFSGYAYTKKNVRRVCEDYLQGLEWIWAYYTGKEDVCYNWYYPHGLPPLWCWLASHSMEVHAPPIQLRADDIRPVEQLALVLPLESWNLIPPGTDLRLRTWPQKAPHYFPCAAGWEMVGRRYFWECEAAIPVPSIAELKAYLTF